MRVLVLNAGSSTLKASVLDGDGRDPLFATTLDWGADATRAERRLGDFEALLEHLVVEGIPVGSIEAVGHRVVHGGTRFTTPVMVDDNVLAALDALADLAPLHNPVAVETIRAALAALPGVPEVAAFDTAFHATLPPPAFTYPVPATPTSPDACSSPSPRSSEDTPAGRRRTSIPGATEPERVPIIRPSSVVMPIDVQRERPSATAVTEQPLPRCATTSASVSDATSSSSPTRVTDHATDNPWNP